MTESQQIRAIFERVIDDFNRSAWGAECAAIAGKQSAEDPRLCAQMDAVARCLGRGEVLLDIGTGYGITPEVFHRFGCKVISVDFPKTGGTFALSRLVEIGIKGYYAHVGAEPLQLADDSVDVVLVGDVIEHLPHTPRPLMADLVRIVKPGGFVVLTTPNAVRLEMRLKMMMGGSPWPRLESYYNDEVNCHHHKEYTQQELKALLAWSGLDLVEFSFHHWHYKSLLPRVIHALLLPVLMLRPAWMSGMLAVGRKPNPTGDRV